MCALKFEAVLAVFGILISKLVFNKHVYFSLSLSHFQFMLINMHNNNNDIRQEIWLNSSSSQRGVYAMWRLGCLQLFLINAPNKLEIILAYQSLC